MANLVAVLFCVALVAVVLVAVRRRMTRKSAVRVVPTRARQDKLSAYFGQERPYKIFVGVKNGASRQWIAAVGMHDGTIELDNGTRVPVTDVRAFIVAYPSGEILDTEAPFHPLPSDVFWMQKAEDTGAEENAPSESALRLGASVLSISFGKSASRSKDANHYSTRLKNESGERIRVRRFGAFSAREGRMRLNTVNGGFFSEQQFAEWYGVESDGWIRVGETVSDPNNYGGTDNLWVYYFETESGKQFVVGGRASQDCE